MIERLLLAAMTVLGMVGALVGAVSEYPGLAAGGAFTLFALSGFTLMWNSWRRENGRVTRAYDKQERKLKRCERDKNYLIQLCQINKVNVPNWIILGEEDDAEQRR